MLKKILILLLVCFSFIPDSFAEEELRIKGIVTLVELELSKDPLNPNLWPCLSIGSNQVMLIGQPDILEELSYLVGYDVLLKAKRLPKQKFGEKEYNCFDVTQIEKIDDRAYLSSRTISREFLQALEKVRNSEGELESDMIDKGIVRSIWFDKNENKIIDTGDRLFITSRSVGKQQGNKYIFYASRAVLRQYKDKTIYYSTFFVRDPFPASIEPAALGILKYDADKDAYTLEVNMLYNGKGDARRIPNEDEKNISLNKNELLKPFVNKKVMLIGDNYEAIFLFGDSLPIINWENGQYVVIVKGNISIKEIDAPQPPWKLSLAFLKDNEGNEYELRQAGYIGFWEQFKGKQVTITGALRPIEYYNNKPTCVIEVFSIEE